MKKIMALFFSTFAAIQFAAAEPSTNDVIYVTDQFKLTPQSQHEDNKKIPYSIETSYPQLTGKLSPSAEKFNQLISELVEQEVLRFKKYVAADMVHMKNLPEEARQNSLHIDYDVDVISPNNNTVISVRLSIEGMQAGRAHPYHTNHVLNYDLAQEKVLTLADLFKPKSKYLAVISNYCRDALNKKLKSDQFMVAEGTKPIEKNFKNWSIDEDSIVFTFEEYQVAPYVYGSQEVDIPYAVLKELIAPTSPIMPCVMDSKNCK